MEEGAKYTIPLEDIVHEVVEEQHETYIAVKPPPPHSLSEISADRNRRLARKEVLDAARKRVEERQMSKRSHKADINYFTGDAVDIWHLREEKHLAALIVDRANYLEHTEDTSKPLQLSQREVLFHNYLTGQIYLQTITITNPGPKSRRYSIIPPEAPFTCETLAGELKPGISKTIKILFQPQNCADANSVLTIRAKNFIASIPIHAANEKANFKLLECCLDNNENADISHIIIDEIVENEKDCYKKILDVDLGPMIFRHSQRHTLSLVLQHQSTVSLEEYKKTHTLPVQSHYKQPLDAIPIFHSVRITSVSVENLSGDCKMELYINKESCENCHFPADNSSPPDSIRLKPAKDKRARLEAVTTLAQSVGLLDPDGVGVHMTSSNTLLPQNETAVTESSTSLQEDSYVCRLDPNGILSLELEFEDTIQVTDMHVVSIFTAEGSALELHLHGYISSGFVEIVSFGTLQLANRPRSVINVSQFLSGDYTLLPDQLLNLQMGCYTEKVYDIPIHVNISSLPDKLLCVSLLEYSNELARGVIPKNRFLDTPLSVRSRKYTGEQRSHILEDATNTRSVMQHNKNGSAQGCSEKENGISHSPVFSIGNITTLADIPTEDNGQIDCYVKIFHLYISLNRTLTTPQRCILEFSYHLHQIYAPILRIILTINPLRQNLASINMLETALAEQHIIDRLTDLKSEKRTDYIFISKPSIDFGLVSVSETANFSFSVRNCSRTVFFPFIVSINLKSHAVSITAGQMPNGISFILHDNTIEGKSRKIFESIEFPDVVEMLDNAKRTSAIEKLKPVITKAGMELKGDEEINTTDMGTADTQHFKQALPGNVDKFLKHNKLFIPTNVPSIRTAQGGRRQLKEMKVSKCLANSCLGTTINSALNNEGKGPVMLGTSRSGDEGSSVTFMSESLKSRIMKNKGNIMGLNDILSIYPSCGILPPRTQVKINVELCPLSIGPIEAFLVINTPSSQYYTNVIRRIQTHLKEQEMRMSMYQSGLNKHALQRIYKERCLVTVPELELIRYQEKLSNTRLYSASDKPVDGLLGHVRSHANLHCTKSKRSLKALTDTSSLDDEQSPWHEVDTDRLLDNTDDQIKDTGAGNVDGIMSNDRDVCCRVFGVVVAPSVEFLEESITPTIDSVKSVTVHIKNTGLTEVTVNLAVMQGDAMLIQPITDEQRANLTPNSLMALVNSTLLRKEITITLGIGEIIPIDVMPGAEHNSYVVARKDVASFGAMAYKINKDQQDLNNNVMLSAVLIKARMESPRPYIYLANDPHNKYIISNPKTLLTPEIFLDTKPYKPVVVEFVIANPSGNLFTAELTTGPDLVAPSTIKVPPKSKTFAAFAILPDRSGQMQTFINFHDCPVKITLNAIGPDIVISCPYIKNFNFLVDHQGMADDVLSINGPLSYSKDAPFGPRQQKKSSKWDEILAILPNRIVHFPLTYKELTDVISDCADPHTNQSANENTENIVQCNDTKGESHSNVTQKKNPDTNSNDKSPVYRMTVDDVGRAARTLPNYLDILDNRKYGTLISQTATFSRQENDKRPLDFAKIMTSQERFQEIRQYLPSISFSKTVAETTNKICIQIFNPTVTDMDVEIKVYDIPNSFIGLTATRDKSGRVYLHPIGPFVSESVEHKPDFGRLGPKFNMTLLNDGVESESNLNSNLANSLANSTAGNAFTAQLLHRHDAKGRGINKHFKASPEHVVIGSQKSANVYIETSSFDTFREFEALLSIKGLFILLKCERVQPKISLCDGIELITVMGSYEHDTNIPLNIANPTDDCTYKILLDVQYPFELVQNEFATTPTLLRPHALIDFNLCLSAINCLKMAQNQWLKKIPKIADINTTIFDLLKQERTKFFFDSTLTVVFPECLDSMGVPYNIVFPVACRVDAPSISPEFTNIIFQPIFVGEYSTKYITIENPTHMPASWELLHIPLKDVQGISNMALRQLPSLHHLENLKDLKSKYMISGSKDTKLLLQSVSSTFQEQDYGFLFYDSLSNTILVDDPSVFTFDTSTGCIEGHDNMRPYKSLTITSRFTPTDSVKRCALHMTKHGDKKIKFSSVFYIRVYAGSGAWVFLTGEVTEDVFQI